MTLENNLKAGAVSVDIHQERQTDNAKATKLQIRRLSEIKGVVAATFALLVTVTPITAAGARAFVWNDALGGGPSPNGYYQNNSSGGINSVVNLAPGKYQVNLPGLGSTSGGTVHVSAYGGNHYCKTQGWSPSGTAMQVLVNCFTPSGTPVNGLFTVLFYAESRPDTTTNNAYLWANAPTLASYTPTLSYQWNSKRQTNTMVRSGTGSYQAKLSGLTASGGSVMVTAYGSGSERCKVADWYGSASGLVTDILCFRADGTAADAQFTLSYITDAIVGGDRPYMGAFAWADQPYAQSYTPSSIYQFNQTNSSSSAVTIQRSAAGDYRMTLPAQAPYNKTAALVTGYGRTSDYCNIASWVQSAGTYGTTVNIKCYNQSGAQVDALYTVQYVTNNRLPEAVYALCPDGNDYCWCSIYSPTGSPTSCGDLLAICQSKGKDTYTCDSWGICYCGTIKIPF